MTLLVLLPIVFLPTITRADVFMKQLQKSSGFQMMGKKQGAKEETRTLWMGKGKFRSDGQEQSILIDQAKKLMYIIDHKSKTITQFPLDLGTAVADKMKSQDAFDENKKDMMKFAQGMMNLKISVEATNETKKIRNWNCTKYIQTIESAMGPVTSEIWASEDLKVDENMYTEFSAAIFAIQSMMGKSMQNMMEEMKKIKGVAVLTLTTTKLMGFEIKSSTELLEFKEGTPPAGTYSLPEHYKRKKGGIFDK